jgi:polyhydroxybutyrate depolymerase
MGIRASSVLIALVLALGVARAWADPPDLTGTVQHELGTIGAIQRHFILYTPKHLPPHPALVFAFHGAGGDGAFMRLSTGYEFDRLADANGFLVIYPYGIGQSWNACRARSISRATRRNIDDVAFVDAMIAQEVREHAIDLHRVFAAGHSNGGAMAYRLALERPGEFAAIAAISANLPAPGSSDCMAAPGVVPVLIMNGTEDPVVSYRGGRILRGTLNEGYAMSTEETARFFVARNGLPDVPEILRLAHVKKSDSTWVERTMWRAAGKAPVVLYTIHGGGHVVPQPYFRYPNAVGQMTADVNAPRAIWDFFESVVSK